ncbi:MAG TPA: hypothetical protein DG414_05470 [Gammaproteobacteria bacterium]|nr:hypothetical protein [Gammaproteobacteria bacterium]
MLRPDSLARGLQMIWRGSSLVLAGTYPIGIYPYYFTFFITGDPSLPGNYRGKEIPQNDTFVVVWGVGVAARSKAQRNRVR